MGHRGLAAFHFWTQEVNPGLIEPHNLNLYNVQYKARRQREHSPPETEHEPLGRPVDPTGGLQMN